MKSYYLELPSQISSNDRGSLNSDLYRLWQNAFVVGKDDPIKSRSNAWRYCLYASV